MHLQAKFKKILNDYVSKSLIKFSSSKYSSPCFLMKKDVDKYRIVGDYRKLNLATVDDTYSLPRIDDILVRLAGKQIFSTLDLTGAYYNIPMAKESAEKTAFITPFGATYEWCVMPYGLKGATSTFQIAMDMVLRSLVGVNLFVYVDNILVASDSWEDHLRDVSSLVQLLGNAGLKVKIKKAILEYQSSSFSDTILMLMEFR